MAENDGRLFYPREHIRTEQFAWDDDQLHLVGLTPIGRATISALRLNRESLLNLRWAMILLGLHPAADEEGTQPD